ncbi:major facilitator transporter [Caballeronia sordidicola]|uniref:Major facilitator transporter n=1 Tax=Caballeronia sordidicola TaxID=196367 RepID=A0A158IA95_CABSO|nr:MFS transporter [Caballeronia sordidicola]SAL53522.1 major facilitator transporter [Caballeronia sordidicola]
MTRSTRGPAGELTAASPATTGRMRLRWVILAITSLVLILNYADRAALGVAGSHIIKEFGLTKTEFGLISSVFFIGYAPFCFIGGWLSDKYGPRVVMGMAVGWWSLFTALTAAGAGYLSFMVIRFLFGFGEGPQGAVTIKTMRNWFPQRQMGTAVGVSQGCTPLGGAIGTPLVAWLIAGTGDWRTPFIVLGVLGLLMTVGWFVLVRDTPEKHPWAVEQDATDIADIVDPDVAQVADEDAPPVSFYIRQPLVLATALAFFGYAWVLYSFLSWFPVYLVEARGVNLKEVALTGALPWLLGFVGYLLGGVLTDNIAVRTGRPAFARKSVIVVGLTLTAILLCFVGLATTLTGAMVLMSSVVFLLYLTGSQYFTLISDTIPKSRLGGVVGFVHFLANTSGVFAPLAVGAIVDRTHSWVLTFGVSAGVCIAGVVAILVWGRTPPRAPLAATSLKGE